MNDKSGELPDEERLEENLEKEKRPQSVKQLDRITSIYMPSIERRSSAARLAEFWITATPLNSMDSN